MTNRRGFLQSVGASLGGTLLPGITVASVLTAAPVASDAVEVATVVRQSKFKVGDTVNLLRWVEADKYVPLPENFKITEVVYDLNKHTSDTHMYVVKNDRTFGFWFESDLVLSTQEVES